MLGAESMDVGQGRVGAGFTRGREEAQGEHFSSFAVSDIVLASAPAKMGSGSSPFGSSTLIGAGAIPTGIQVRSFLSHLFAPMRAPRPHREGACGD
jgi:hypothetical protein